MDAISQLPLLENIHLTFLGRPSNLDRLRLPTSAWSKLKYLSMHFTCLRYLDPVPWKLSNAKRTICHLIANSPELEHLEVGPTISRSQDDKDLLDLDDFFLNLQAQSSFAPSLRSFRPWAMKFPKLNAMGFFKQLSCLEVPNDREEDEPIWSALRASGIKLATIKVEFLTLDLIEYIRTYRGLRAFHVCEIHMSYREYAQDDMVMRLLKDTLREHSETLSDLRFCPSRDREEDGSLAWGKTDSVMWDIPGLLRYMQPFGCLERLTLMHYTDDMSDGNQRESLVGTFHYRSCVCPVPHDRNRLRLSTR